MEIIRLKEECYDERSLEDYDIQFAIYYYENYGYEGNGMCIGFKEGMWYSCGMSHCSCNGPLDDFNLEHPKSKLKDVFKQFSSKHTIHFKKVVDMIYYKVNQIMNKTLFYDEYRK